MQKRMHDLIVVLVVELLASQSSGGVEA